MAESSILANQFTCSVCLELLKDPVTIPCGHSYCMSCIAACWDQEERTGVYSCPQCRQAFATRPVLGKNTILVEMMEKLNKMQLQAAVPTHCYTGAGDVECDICSETKQKAVKSCLVCQESYCQTHFERHEEFRSGKPHKVIDATGSLQEIICQQHAKQLEIYCRTDQTVICYLCTIDGHKNHDTVTAAAERSEKQKQLEKTQRDVQQNIQQKESDLQKLRDDLKSYKCSAQTAVEDCESTFTELIRSIERSRSEVTQLIRDQEKAAVSQAEKLLEDLELEINDLKRRDSELEEILHTDNHIHFLQSFQSLPFPGVEILNIFDNNIFLPFDDVKKSVFRLREKLEDFCKEEIQNVSRKAPESQRWTPAAPESQHRTPAAPESQHSPILVPKVQPGPILVPKEQPSPISVPKVQPRPIQAQESEPRLTFGPNLQPSSMFLQKSEPKLTFGPMLQPSSMFFQESEPKLTFGPTLQPSSMFFQESEPKLTFGPNVQPGSMFLQKSEPKLTFGPMLQPSSMFFQGSEPKLTFGPTLQPGSMFLKESEPKLTFGPTLQPGSMFLQESEPKLTFGPTLQPGSMFLQESEPRASKDLKGGLNL